MQLITFLSAAAATVATVSADSAVQLNSKCDSAKPYARVINRCDYPVYLWSVFKGVGCPTSGMVTLKKGEIYSENYQQPLGGDQGVSIKVSKTTECKGSDIVQLEYFLEERPDKQPYWGNYLDVSYVDCTDGDCPTKQEGYYLQAGTSAARAARASADNTWCPILSCSDPISCAKMSYILPDDVQTKTCDLDQNMDFYMCGSHAPSDSDYQPAPSAASSAVSSATSAAPWSSSAPASSFKMVNSSVVSKPSTTLKVVASSAAYKVSAAAAVTSAPDVKDAAKSSKVKTKVVYVTTYVNDKRHEHAHAHAHAHARRHQPFHA